VDPKDDSIPSASKIKKQQQVFQLAPASISFWDHTGMLSYPDIPKKQRSLFFDVWGFCAKGTLGLKKAFG